MKNYRLFLLGFTTVSYLFLSGFNQSDHPPDTKPPSIKRATSSTKAKSDGGKALQRPLDLTIPFKGIENAGQSKIVDDSTQNAVDALFAPKLKKDGQPLQLKGGWLMSPEPEVEKRKSVDGAGIVIDLKP
ncbi:MAG: hypothetical protein Q8N96_01390 [Methylovulum sp.]|nr:hypothetical protein [Methylovulum sp.]